MAPLTAQHRLTNRDGSTLEFAGKLLGHGTSFRDGKERWFEVDIYSHSEGGWIVHTQGRSVIDGERTLTRIVQTSSAFEIVELLTVNHGGRQFLPSQSARALAQAAQWDDDVRDAYVNRAVI